MTDKEVIKVIAQAVSIDEENPTEEVKKVTKGKDIDFEEEQDATWGEVMGACCVHSPKEWGTILVGIVMLLFFLYFFLFGLDLLGTSAKIIGGCAAGGLFPEDTNPIGGLMIGILATVLLQSSSTTTSIIVGLVGGDALNVELAIYMVMGANIGTSVTNTIVAMGQMGDGDQLERAFAGATVHDMFNFLTVAILLPVEWATGYLYRFSSAILPETVAKGDKWEGPLKKIVSPLTKKIIIANKDIIKALAIGEDKSGREVDSCDDFYPVQCDGEVNHANCKAHFGLISCDKTTGNCPLFFQDGSLQKDDEVSGGVCLFLSLVILVACLIGLVTLLQKLLMGASTRVIYKATNINPYLAILAGTAVTLLVQSSSITTSALTPLVGMDVLRLEQMLPLTLGANIGTTFTGLLAALVSSKIESLQVAICHLFFNITGILIWFPVPFMRNVPLNAARKLGQATRIWRGFPILYIMVIFFALPLAFVGLSTLFEQDSIGMTVLGSFIVGALVLVTLYGAYWYKFKDGSEKIVACMNTRQAKTSAMKSLPSDMEYLKAEIIRIKEHTGIIDDA